MVEIELPYDPAIPLLHIYPEKTIIQKDTCTPVFTAVLYYTSQDLEEPKMSIDRWMDEDVVPMYNGLLLNYEKSK